LEVGVDEEAADAGGFVHAKERSPATILTAMNAFEEVTV
jgi:hypothetical protein